MRTLAPHSSFYHLQISVGPNGIKPLILNLSGPAAGAAPPAGWFRESAAQAVDFRLRGVEWSLRVQRAEPGGLKVSATARSGGRLLEVSFLTPEGKRLGRSGVAFVPPGSEAVLVAREPGAGGRVLAQGTLKVEWAEAPEATPGPVGTTGPVAGGACETGPRSEGRATLAGSAMPGRASADFADAQWRAYQEGRPLQVLALDGLLHHAPGSPFVETVRAIRRAAAQNLRVLVTGERGSGKEHVATALHQASPRAQGPLVPFNCATLNGADPKMGLGELVGYGANSGLPNMPREGRQGFLDMAIDGTVVVDEVQALPLPTQESMLRFLQDGTYYPAAGELKLRKSNAVIVCLTDADPDALVAAGRMSRAFKDRIDGFVIKVAPLRERRMDIPVLLHVLCRDAELRVKFAERLFKAMLCSAWSGNTRDLVKFLQNCKAETGAYPLDFADLPRLNLSDRLLQELREGAAAYDTSAAQRPTYDPWASLVDRAVTIAREALKSAFAAAQQNDAAAWRTAIVRGWSRFQDGLASCVLATGDLPRVPTDLLTSLTTVLGSRKEAKRLVRRIYRQLETVAKSTSQHEENVGGRGQSVSLLFGAHYHTIRRGSQWAGDGAGDS